MPEESVPRYTINVGQIELPDVNKLTTFELIAACLDTEVPAHSWDAADYAEKFLVPAVKRLANELGEMIAKSNQ